MKIVILAGGFGTRISEETDYKPKPMIEIGGKPILWHIMKIYAHYGFYDFVICLGYKHYVIKEFFQNYYMRMSDVTFDLENNTAEVHNSTAEPWKVTLVHTGESTMTGGRIKRIQDYVKEDDLFCCTYGDGVADIDIPALIDFHKKHKKLATLTAVQPLGRFGILGLGEEGAVEHFHEKPAGDGSYVNGGFFVLSPKVLDYIEGDETIWEKEPLEQLVKEDQLMAFKHHGFWHPMDTLRDKNHLEALWSSGQVPWKKW